jgi:hypothetical protein
MALQSLKHALVCVYGTEGQGFESLLARWKVQRWAATDDGAFGSASGDSAPRAGKLSGIRSYTGALGRAACSAK